MPASTPSAAAKRTGKSKFNEEKIKGILLMTKLNDKRVFSGHMFSDLVPRIDVTSLLGLAGGAGTILFIMILLVFVVRCRKRSTNRPNHNYESSKRSNLKLDEGSKKRCAGHKATSRNDQSSPDKQPVVSSRDSICQQQSEDSSLLLDSPNRGKHPVDTSLMSTYDQGPSFFQVSDGQGQWGGEYK